MYSPETTSISDYFSRLFAETRRGVVRCTAVVEHFKFPLLLYAPLSCNITFISHVCFHVLNTRLAASRQDFSRQEKKAAKW